MRTLFSISPAPRSHLWFSHPADNALAFQAAIDAAAKLAGPGRHGGKAVHIPPGNWTLNQTVFINSSFVVLRGSGVSRPGLQAKLGRNCTLLVHASAADAASASCTCVRLRRPPPAMLSQQMGRTTLYFPNGLEAVYGTKTWQYSGAFLG